jgi:hypothetical protein
MAWLHADRVETVTPFFVDGVLRNKKHGGKVHVLRMPSKTFMGGCLDDGASDRGVYRRRQFLSTL